VDGVDRKLLLLRCRAQLIERIAVAINSNHREPSLGDRECVASQPTGEIEYRTSLGDAAYSLDLIGQEGRGR
jgi:hypothetical protein